MQAAINAAASARARLRAIAKMVEDWNRGIESKPETILEAIAREIAHAENLGDMKGKKSPWE